jgi:hypothetical protein
MSVAAYVQESLLGWRAKSPSKAAALHLLLSDLQWHSQRELQDVAGMRFGARLFDLHNVRDMDLDARPLHYRKRFVGEDDSHIQYQQVDKAGCDICTAEARKRPAQVIAELRAEAAALRAELARRDS